ncbi:hypothetical protein GH5_04060 [Leishmania sp. Ghana 2012 LV757]|uniref:hypothetical protein n=1 Tax=Leishmania sp. Ghana 2012 LV757 TaxID=2803181 RepID=UPI001B65D93E|nr:hypothetical protein GH5_04060 [Leishmania sp. Ghana 2012 LV757]
MEPSSTCTPAVGIRYGLPQVKEVGGPIRLSRRSAEAASSSQQVATRLQCASLPLGGGGHHFRGVRAESAVAVAAVAERCTLSHGMALLTLSRCSQKRPRRDEALSSLSSLESAAQALLLRCSLSRLLLCSLLTASAATKQMLTSPCVRRHTAQISASRQEHAVREGVAVLHCLHKSQVRRLLGAVIAADGRGAPMAIRLGCTVRAFTTAATLFTSGDADAPPASPESFLDLNELSARLVPSGGSSAASVDAASIPESKGGRHRFSPKQRRHKQRPQVQPPQGSSGESQEEPGSSQGSLQQHGHGVTRLGGTPDHGRPPSKWRQRRGKHPGPSAYTQMRFGASPGSHSGTTPSAAPSSARGDAAHGRRRSSRVMQSDTASVSTIHVRAVEAEEVRTTWREPAGRRVRGLAKLDHRSAVDGSATGQSSRSASCAPPPLDLAAEALAAVVEGVKASTQNAPAPPAAPIRASYANTGEPDYAALRRLVQSHYTFRRNYETLHKSDRVVVAFERLCAEAVAHSRLVEHLALALGSARQAATPVRLLLTGSFDEVQAADTGGEAAPPTKSLTAKALAVLEVPLSVVDWLNEPIIVPELSTGTLVESVHQVLSSAHAAEGPMSDFDGAGAGEAVSASVGASPAALCQQPTREAMNVWYDAWGREQHFRQAATGPPSRCSARATPSLEASMTLWHRGQCAWESVLLSHLTEVGRPSVVDAWRVCPGSREGVNTRNAPPAERDPGADVGARRSLAERGEHAAMQPGEVVVEAMRELLPYLVELLQTLSGFKAAREEANMQAEYHALLESATAWQSGPATAAATAAQGTYTHLCLVARRLCASPPVEQHPQPADSDISDKHLSDGCGVGEELCTAAQQYLRLIPKVDEVVPHPGQSQSEDEGATPLYSAAVLDIFIGVLLRCLLFHLPALSARDRRRVLQQLSAPWLAQAPEGSARAACWSTFFGIADLLSKAHAPAQQERIAALPCAMVGPDGDGNANSSCSFTIDHFTASTLKEVVQELRSLCWPTVLDRHSSIVQHALCLPPAVPAASPSPLSSSALARGRQQQQRPPTDTLHKETGQGVSASSAVTAYLSPSPRSRAPAWSDVVAVVRGSERLQRLGYELLIIFFGALQCGRALRLAGPVVATAAAEERSLLCRRSSGRCPLSTVCIYALDVDRFISERMGSLSPAAGLLPLLRTQSSPSTGSGAPPPDSRSALMELLANQTVHPYGLSRLALCTLSTFLLQSWSAMSPQRAQLLLTALQRAVAAPAALTLRSLLLDPHPSTRAGCQSSGTGLPTTPPSAMQLAAGCSEWRAVASLMLRVTSRASLSLWRTMWGCVSSELRSLPLQMKEVRAVYASAGDGQDGDTTVDAEGLGPSSGGHTFCKQLEGLATMCAWLVTMAPSVFEARHTGAGVAMSAPAQMSALRYCERVKLEFAQCVQSVLAVWTQTGASAGAAEQLLCLFPRHPSAVAMPVNVTAAQAGSDGAIAEVAQDASALALAQGDRAEDEVVTLLMRLAEAAQTHVWTRALRGAVEGWIEKTRYIQARSRGVKEAVQFSTTAEAPASALDAMPAAAAAPSATAGDGSTGETMKSSGSDAFVATASLDVDSALLTWWRTMAEEDIGLPSTRISLVQVYRVLLRIVAARATLAPLTPPREKADEKCAFESEGNAALMGEETGAGAVKSGGKPRASLPDGTPVVGAADSAIFSATEVVIIVRVLSSIAARDASAATISQLPERSCRWDARGKTSSPNSAENAVGRERTSGDGESIIDSLRRAAVTATAAAASAPLTATLNSAPSKDPSARGLSFPTGGSDNNNPPTVGVAEEAAERSRGGAAVLSAQEAVERIEKALLISLRIHSGALPAATTVEAAWLRLFPLSALQKLLDQKEWPVTNAHELPMASRGPSPSESLSAQPAVCANITAAAVLPPLHFPCAAVVTPDPALHLDGSLRESPSPWLRKLHDAVVTSRHSREIGICLVSSMYFFLAAPQKRDYSPQSLSEVARGVGVCTMVNDGSVSCDGTLAAASSCVSNCVAGAGASSRLRGFLERLRTSCAEAVVLFHQARGQNSDLAAASGKGDTAGCGGAGAEDTDTSQVGLAAAASAAVAEADGAEGGGTDAGASRTAALQEEHGRRFCHVLVVASELHERLSPYTEALTCAAARCTAAEQNAGQDALLTFRNGKTESARRQLWLLYRSLLDAVAHFVPYGEHGNAAEVMQMLGVITRRMPWPQGAPQLLSRARPFEQNGQSGDNSSDGAEVEAALTAKRGKGALAARAAALLSTLDDGSEEDVLIDPLLLCFREQVSRLMPYVDAEVLRCTKVRVPLLLRLALISGAKSSVEFVLRSAPASSSRTMPPRGGASAVAAGGSRSGAAFDLSSVRTAAKRNASESPSHGTASETVSGPLGLSTRPLWSQVPLESLLHQSAMDRLMVSRHALYLCTLVTNAPEFSMVLLPLSPWLRDAQARISWDMLEVVFKAVAVSAVNFQRHNQAEMLLRDAHLPPLSPSASPKSDQVPSGATSSAHGASSASSADRPRRSGGDGDASQRGALAVPRSLTEGSSLRVGEMRYPRGTDSVAPAPLFRSAAVPSTMWNAPPQLRHTWGDLARRLLREEDDPALRDSSLWVSALYCGAMVNCAGTQVFAQLLACLVFGATTPAASAAITATRITTLDVVGWTLVLKSCGTALEQNRRQSYQALLREEFLAFLERTAASAQDDGGGVFAPFASTSSPSPESSVSAAGPWRGVLDDELPLAGAWRCGLLEAIPQLFLEDAVFWSRVKECVESWCAAMELEPAELASEMPSAQRRSTSAARLSWVTQLHQSFNWAAQCAGQSSLVFTDTWTTATANADAHAVDEWMKMQLESLGMSTASV